MTIARAVLVFAVVAAGVRSSSGQTSGAKEAPPSPPAQAAQPATSPSTPPSGETAASAAVAYEEDERLAQRLLKVSGDVEARTSLCLDLAWNPDEPDAGLRAAALMGGIYRSLGGVNNIVNTTLAEQIRSSDISVATKAISVCSMLGIEDSYLPMRERASRPGSPLRKEAIEGIARLHDGRAIIFFKSLLDTHTAPREEIYQALADLGRPAALLLKSKLDDPQPEERRMALDALLRMATAEDLSALYAYIQKYPPQGDLKKQIYDKIATLEAKQYERPLTNGD